MKPIAATVRRSAVAGSKRRRATLLAPTSWPRLLDDRRVDGVELERGAHGAGRLVELALLAPAALLAVEQLGALEGEGREAGEDLHEAQLLGAERALGRA